MVRGKMLFRDQDRTELEKLLTSLSHILAAYPNIKLNLLKQAIDT